MSPKNNNLIDELDNNTNRGVQLTNHMPHSVRRESVIYDLNRLFLPHLLMKVQLIGRGFTNRGTSAIDCLFGAIDIIRIVEKRQGIFIIAPEEIAYPHE